MSYFAQTLALKHASTTCKIRQERLEDALADLEERLAASRLERLSPDDRRLLDQFAYRYSRLQEDVVSRLMPAILRALGEDAITMPALARMERLEQLGWLPAAQEWVALWHACHEFARTYPEAEEECFQRLQLALASARRLLEILAILGEKTRQHFPGVRT